MTRPTRARQRAAESHRPGIIDDQRLPGDRLMWRALYAAVAIGGFLIAAAVRGC